MTTHSVFVNQVGVFRTKEQNCVSFVLKPLNVCLLGWQLLVETDEQNCVRFFCIEAINGWKTSTQQTGSNGFNTHNAKPYLKLQGVQTPISPEKPGQRTSLAAEDLNMWQVHG